MGEFKQLLEKSEVAIYLSPEAQLAHENPGFGVKVRKEDVKELKSH